MTVGRGVQTAAAVLLLAGLGALWLRDHDGKVREAAMAEHAADSLRLEVGRERGRRAIQHRADSVAAARRIAQADSVAGAARTAARVNGAAYGALLDELAATADSTGLFHRLAEGWHQAEAQYQQALADDSLAIAARDARYAALEASYAADLAAVDQQLDAALRQLAAALKRSRPGFFSRLVQALPWVGGGIAIVEGARALMGH
jgi:hypothetical protein